MREFYSNLQAEGRTQITMVHGVEVNISLVAINGILRTLDVQSGLLTEVQIRHPYQAM